MFTKVALFTANRSLKDAWKRLMQALLGIGRVPAINAEKGAILAGDLVAPAGEEANAVWLAESGQGMMQFIGICVLSSADEGLPVEYQYNGECDARFVAGLTLNEGEQVFCSGEKGLATNVANANGAIGTIVDATAYGGLAGDKATIAIAQKTHLRVPEI